MNALTPKAGSTSIASLLAKAKTQAVSAQGKGRIIFAVDATGSREPTWNMAKKLQTEMLATAARIGTLEVGLAYFRGHGEVKFAHFTNNADELINLMSQVSCAFGMTQITTILEHSLFMHDSSPLNAVVLITDTIEDFSQRTRNAAEALGAKGVPVFIFHEEAQSGTGGLKEIAALSKGAYASFSEGSAEELKALLQSIAAYATGGIKALTKAAETSDTARLLLTQLK